MGNLGWYQLIVVVAKKVKGPANLIGIVAVGGYGVLRVVELSVKKVAKVSKAAIKKRSVPSRKFETIFTVTADCEERGGLKLKVGDKYRVLERDADSIQLEVLGDSNNPYFVSIEFLKSISDFDIDDDAEEK